MINIDRNAPSISQKNSRRIAPSDSIVMDQGSEGSKLCRFQKRARYGAKLPSKSSQEKKFWEISTPSKVVEEGVSVLAGNLKMAAWSEGVSVQSLSGENEDLRPKTRSANWHKKWLVFKGFQGVSEQIFWRFVRPEIIAFSVFFTFYRAKWAQLAAVDLAQGDKVDLRRQIGAKIS